MVSVNVYCYHFRNTVLLNCSEPLLLIVGSENILFDGCHTGLLQPESLPQKNLPF